MSIFFLLSKLYNGERRQKTDPIFETLGAVDELNACLGIAREHCEFADNGLQHMFVYVLLISESFFCAVTN